MTLHLTTYTPQDLWLAGQPDEWADDDYLVLAQLRPFTDHALTPGDLHANIWPALFVERADVAALLNLWPTS